MPRRISLFGEVTRAALLGGAGFFVVAQTSATAQSDQGIFELRCRGGQDLFVYGDPTIPDSDLSISFSWTLQGFSGDGTGLEPGTCGWLDRLYREGEPSQIELSVGGTRAAMLEALADPDRYWSFWVFNTNLGYLLATRNGATAPDVGVMARRRDLPVTAPGSAGAPDSGVVARPGRDLPVVGDTGVVTRPDGDPPVSVPGSASVPDSGVEVRPDRDLPVVGDTGVVTRPDSDDDVFVSIHNVHVSPRLGGVAISFEALPGQVPLVTISRMVPVPRGVGDPGMEPQFAARTEATQTPVVRGKLATYAATIGELGQGEQHRYELTVPQTGSGRAATEAGDFTTLARRVRVTVTAFHILDDGDDLSNGDLSFHMIANPGEPTQHVEPVRDGDRTVMEWESGRTYKVQHEFTIERAPPRLRLVAAGRDDDDGILPGCYLSMPSDGDRWADVWKRISSSSRIFCEEFNYAKSEFNVGDAAFGEADATGWRRSRLSMQSMRPNRNVSLEFQVRGWVAVIEE